MIKDPLRYFISEGFGVVVAYRTEDGEYGGEMVYNKLNKDFMPTFGYLDAKKDKNLEWRTMRFPNMNNEQYYLINRDFFETYAEIFDTKKEAVAKLVEYDAEWTEVLKFVEENKHLTA